MLAGLFRKREQPLPNNGWQPVKREYVKDKTLAERIEDTGYAVAGTLDEATLAALEKHYQENHNFETPRGGMFYSLYSRDVQYRKTVHDEIGSILKPVYDSLFDDYRVVLNSYIVKVNGPESEFCLHQDSTGVDETKYSNLSVWIPLQDTNMENGCMCVVPHSHKMFSPYRGISFDGPFEKITDTLRRYLTPIELKKGEILLFDNRLVHNSVVNMSGNDRIVVMSGIYPTGAPLISCYKDPDVADSQIELIEQDDDYLITFPNFLHDCRCRPETGSSAGFVQWDTRQMGEKEFLSLCKKYEVKRTDIPVLLSPAPIQAGLDDRGLSTVY